MTDQPTPRAPERCHCGEPVYTHDDGFSRGMCYECDSVRCDADPGACQPTPRAPEPYRTQAGRLLMTEPYDGHGGDETCPGCPHAAPEPSAPDDLQEQIAAAIDTALIRDGADGYTALHHSRLAAAAVMDVLRREGLVKP